MSKKFLPFFLCFLFLIPGIASADRFERQASYTVCFTPGMDCTAEIVGAINDSVSNIWVQAYSFTSRPISRALVMAKERGVKVQVILDKSALNYKNGAIDYFQRHGVPVWIDNAPAIAHNKVMILDQTKVIMGSFNFTRAAQERNAENLLIIDDKRLAQKYLNNWQSRKNASYVYTAKPREPQNQEGWLEYFINEFLRWLRKWFLSCPTWKHA